MATAASHVLTKGDSPGAAPAGKIRLYADDDGDLIKVDESGNEVDITQTPFGLNSSNLDGIQYLFMPDPQRSNKNLSVTMCQFLWAENSVSNNEWMKIGRATDSDTGHIMPHDGTIIGVTALCENAQSTAQFFRLYINGSQVSSNFFAFPSGSGRRQQQLTDKNTDFSRGDRIRLRAGDNGSIGDTNISLFVKWRS
ncbi:MAG: hypothetical protein DRP56_00895 [Planctomycetota bacterium]|nr:MAG: hypothetical protein DRP56_00895 [Planctomycetota bacterium]RLB91227.1 MAG: hypothetical protein DRH10_02375 [Deltaproteobacteria bacterium]